MDNSPLYLESIPLKIFKRVLLPAPFLPLIMYICPASKLNDKFLKISKLEKDLFILFNDNFILQSPFGYAHNILA